jgi:hypothetical protein
MAVKRTGQMSLVEAFIGHAVGGASGALDRIGQLVKWYRFEKLLAGLRHDGPGHPGWPALVLYKALLLQSLYGCRTASWRRRCATGCRSAASVGLGWRRRSPTTRCSPASATC